ncbi:MAG: hypothetical protein QOC81_1414 [Thermoanaerobaculia bacterium]|jgi:uncharacterized protein (DUF111 family)|nr:hypothetical protein [Thermoanaerobaculia bacterium]
MKRFLTVTALSFVLVPCASAQTRDAQPVSVVATPVRSVDASDAAVLRSFTEAAIRRAPATRAARISIAIDEPEVRVETASRRAAMRTENRLLVSYTITDQNQIVLESQKVDAGRTVRADSSAVNRRVELLRDAGEYIAERAARLDH